MEDQPDEVLPSEPEVKDSTPPPPEQKSHVYRYQSESISEPGMEFALSDGTMGTEKQIALTTQKMTVLKINQLLRRTRKLLATHQESPEELKMEAPKNMNNGMAEAVTADEVFADTCDV